MPSTRVRVRRLCAGYWVLSTMEPAPVATLNGNVASGEDSRKVTVRAPLVSTLPRVSSKVAGPTGELMALTRSKENFTSLAVTARPLGNVSPSRSSQR